MFQFFSYNHTMSELYVKFYFPDVKSFSSRCTRAAATLYQESKRKRCSEIALASTTRSDFDEIVASLYSCGSNIVIDRAILRLREREERERERRTEKARKEETSREIDGGGWTARHGRIRMARVRKTASSLSSEKSRESNESGATGVFATNIYTSATPRSPSLLQFNLCRWYLLRPEILLRNYSPITQQIASQKVILYSLKKFRDNSSIEITNPQGIPYMYINTANLGDNAHRVYICLFHIPYAQYDA